MTPGRWRGTCRRVAPPGAVLAVLALATLTGCGRAGEAPASAYEPANVTTLSGSDLKQVTLTEEAARRVDLRTVPVRRSGSASVIPYAALIYDGKGASWVYTSSEPLTFVRVAVVVSSIDGDSALLTTGPTEGTPVVTVGAAEVYGAELGIAGGH